MTITKNDIKLFQAQDNTDNDSGGGSRTSVEVVDGDVNNLFPDISRLDTVAGRVNLRKIFPTVMTDNNDVYYGAHSMIRKSPTDPLVSALLFHTDDPHDNRVDAQDQIENYVVASYLESFYLYGNHVTGSKAVTFLQMLDAREPVTGEVYLLKDGADEQYIRIIDFTSEQRIFIDVNGKSHTRRQIVCTSEQALEHDFVGSGFNAMGQESNTTDTWGTQVADASKFYSTKTLVEAASIGDTSINVDSIYEQLVPASKSKSFLTNKQALLQSDGLIATGNRMEYSVGSVLAGAVIQLRTPILPTSITRVGEACHDDGFGNLIEDASGDVHGNIDYKNGIITITDTLRYTPSDVEYEVAVLFDSDIQFSTEIVITNESVGNVFSRRLKPLPSVGALYIDYRSGGKWYRFAANADRDSGIETIGGDPLIGSGSLYDNEDGTGTVNMTFAALPDMDSAVVISWGSAERLSNQKDLIDSQTTLQLVIDLGVKNIDPLSFIFNAYTSTLATHYAITATADGTLVDSISSTTLKVNGVLDYINGKVYLNGGGNAADGRLSNTQDSTIDFDYADVSGNDVGAVQTVVASRTPEIGELSFGTEDFDAGTLTVNLGESVDVNSLTLILTHGYLTYGVSKGVSATITLRSNSTGDLIESGTGDVWGSVSAAGVISFTFPDKTYYRAYMGEFVGFGSRYTNEIRKARIDETEDDITIQYTTGSPASYDESVGIADVISEFATYKIQTVPNIVGEISFISNDKSADSTYTVDGLVYRNGVQIGTIDYKNGVIEHVFDGFTNETTMTVDFDRIFTDESLDDNLLTDFTFRTAASNLTTSSFGMVYETINGSFSATSDGDGVITGTDIDSDNSYVDTITGMVHLEFTAPCVAESIRYDGTAETSQPLDPELLGLNPVRLPADGRVPVFKSGYITVIFNEVTTAIGTPNADDVETLARDKQSMIEVIDVNGKRLDPTQYVADRDAGTVTFGNLLTLEDKYSVALTPPLSIVDRVEDMVMINDAQINGLLSISAPLTHNYTQGDTYVASALTFGDTGSRVYTLFEQEYWDSGSPVWDDERIGDDTTAKYDTINHPIAIDNANSTAERWAIIFTNSTTVKVVGEKLGEVDTGVSIAVDDIAPINPATGLPYFTMVKEGFGTGWVSNNVIRFNTDSGDNNMWVIRTIQAGAASEETDSIDLEVRGDAN